ncbi:hypothetical protein ABIE52_000406 [Rhodococcus sp. OAS809]|uniref:hypothetical protein n=1 Tax=Rhodococcus sp. OAS809 TaxID=2663874 RepID=UPI00178C0474
MTRTLKAVAATSVLALATAGALLAVGTGAAAPARTDQGSGEPPLIHVAPTPTGLPVSQWLAGLAQCPPGEVDPLDPCAALVDLNQGSSGDFEIAVPAGEHGLSVMYPAG